jgi:cell division protein FtsB
MKDKILQTSKEQTMSTLEAIPLTLKLIGSELRWAVVRSLRSIEIRQMEKRLNKEYQKLGQLSAQGQNNADEVTLCQKQIDFLGKELMFLKQELTDLRQDVINKRCRKWGLNSSASTPSDQEHAENPT